jgi:hypothetical protein
MRSNALKCLKCLKYEALAKFAISVIPAKAGIQDALKTWIPGRAPLARNDHIPHISILLQEAHIKRSAYVGSLFTFTITAQSPFHHLGNHLQRPVDLVEGDV